MTSHQLKDMSVVRIPSPVGVDNAHRIPPTPRAMPPQAMNTEDITARFSTVTWMEQGDATIESLLGGYPHWELLEADQTYSKRPYRAAYQGRFGWYQNGLCIVKSGESEQYYVFARALPSPLDSLIPFCPCITCRASRLNPLKYVWCPRCTGCLKAGEGFASEAYRTEAIRLQQLQRPPSRWDRVRKQIWSVTVCEGAVVAVLALVIMLIL